MLAALVRLSRYAKRSGVGPPVKAYRDLETRRLVTRRQGLGTFVTAGPGSRPTADDAGLRRKLGRWLAEAAAGLSREDVAALFESVVRARFAEGVA